MNHNEEHNIKPLPFQYIDYSMFEEKLMKSEEMTSALYWWIKQFDNNSYITKLTLDRPRTSNRTGYGKNIISMLSTVTSSIIFKWMKNNKYTIIMLLQLVLNILLYKLRLYINFNLITPPLF